jgi:uncharacterized protein YecT (DUF1311 family)
MLRTAFPLALLLLLAAWLVAPLAAAKPSFDCRTAKTARELATCADAGIAAADRELAAAWQHALAGLDPATAKALRADQKKFLEDLDTGLEGDVWGKQSPPEGKELRAQIARLRRGGDSDALADLEAQLRERVAFLRSLAPATTLAGLWKNHDSELFLAADGEGRYRATFGATTFGWVKYHCHFTAAFAPADNGFAAAAPHNTDPEVDEDTATRLVLVRSGAMLDLTEEIQDNAAEAKLSRVCPRAGDAPTRCFTRT